MIHSMLDVLAWSMKQRKLSAKSGLLDFEFPAALAICQVRAANVLTRMMLSYNLSFC